MAGLKAGAAPLSSFRRPRLCHLYLRSGFQGYGFMIKEKTNVGEFITDIAPNSPAAVSGLKVGDRVIEINGQNISNESHQRAVQRVKSVPGKVVMLVVDAATDIQVIDKQADRHFCELCEIDCMSPEGLDMHMETMAHRTKVVLLEREILQKKKQPDVQIEENNDAEDEMQAEDERQDESDTGWFCQLCNVPCKNEQGLYVHTQGMAHIMRAAAAGDIQEEHHVQAQQAWLEEADKGPSYCRACKYMCRDEQEYGYHTGTMGHKFKQMEYDHNNRKRPRQAPLVPTHGHSDPSSHYPYMGGHSNPSHYPYMGGGQLPRVYSDSSPRSNWAAPLAPPPFVRAPLAPPPYVLYPLSVGQPPRVAPSRDWLPPMHCPPPAQPAKPKLTGEQDMPKLMGEQDTPNFMGEQDTLKLTEEQETPKLTGEQDKRTEPRIQQDQSSYYCEMCKNTLSTLDNYNEHIVGPKHMKKQRAIDAGGSLLVHTGGLQTEEIVGPADYHKELETTKNYMIGLEYLYEVHRATTIGKPYYVCTMCDESNFDPTSHVTSKEHRQEYVLAHTDDYRHIILEKGPSPDSKYYAWFLRKFRLGDAIGAVKKRPNIELETRLWRVIASEIQFHYGRKLVHKVKEVRGSYVKPLTFVDEYPNIKAINKFNAKRLLVSNLPAEVQEMELFDFLNRQTVNRAIIDLEMGRDNQFAFLTFRSYEETQQFLVFDGLYFKNQPLRVSRPAHYEPLPGQDDTKVFLECHIPAEALLCNKKTPLPASSKYANSLYWKNIPANIPEEVVLEFVNSLLLGTPCHGIEFQPNRGVWRTGFLRFRSLEETTNALEVLVGQIFKGVGMKIARPNSYVAPQESGDSNRGLKRHLPDYSMLYTDVSKFSCVPDEQGTGFRGGSKGFLTSGAIAQQPMESSTPHQAATANLNVGNVPENTTGYVAGDRTGGMEKPVVKYVGPTGAVGSPGSVPAQPQKTPSRATTMLRQSKEFLENETICTDEEMQLAQRVVNQLSATLTSFYNHKYYNIPPDPSISVVSDPDLEEWLLYMSQVLYKTYLEDVDEAQLAREVSRLLSDEIAKYMTRLE